MDFHNLSWGEITDLPEDWPQTLVDAPTHALVESWKQQADDLRQKTLYQGFLERLGREWAIETGIIEGLYDISEAGTKTLIEQGFQASFLTHDDTNQPVADVLNKIRDQYDALQGLYAFVGGQRPLGTSYIRELHQVLTAHQRTYEARDTLGNRVERELPRGVWKSLPNNVEHPDDTQFEFCPPEHVDAEMERLVAMHQSHESQKVPPDVQAAWLHHRFTLIHPFTDGNGRVARCLATLVLLKAHWLPLVVTRTDRANYIDAIRHADRGILRPLVDVFGKLQRIAIRKAFSLTDQVLDEAPALDSLLARARKRLDDRTQQAEKDRDRAVAVADSLCEFAYQRAKAVATQTEQALSTPNFSVKCRADCGRRNDEATENWFYLQSVDAAKKLDYFADRQRYSAWVRLQITAGHRTEILISFHGIGKHPSVVLGAAIMAYSRSRTERSTKGEGAHTQLGPVVLLADEPFEFTPPEDPAAVQQRFQRWLDAGLLRGIVYWQTTI